jgi:threonine dehydrogenase-like Zn-dependent dehydrogenase
VALNTGADIALDPTAQEAGSALKEATGGRGMDVAIECSGSYRALHQAIKSLAFGGTVSVVGTRVEECDGGLTFETDAIMEIVNMVFSRSLSAPDRDHPRWDFHRVEDSCWQWLSEGRFQCDEIVTPVVPFAESVQAYQDMDHHPESCIKLGVEFPTVW